jgi:hypothetical protein
MDEALEVAELAADAGLEGALVWLLRIVGLVLVLVGLGLWLLTEAGLLVLPAALIAVGLLLIAVPGILFGLLELVGVTAA